MENNTDTTTEAKIAQPSKSIDDLIAEMNVNKQDFTPPPSEANQTNQTENNNSNFQQQFNEPQEPKIFNPADLAKAKASATFVVSAVDIGVSEILTMIAKGTDPKPYKATEDEKDDMINVWAEYLKEKGGDIPPGVMVVIMILVVYAPRAKSAFDNKKADKLIAEQKAENETLAKRIAELEKTEKENK